MTLDHIYRAWVEIEPSEHGSTLPVPVFAKPSSLTLAPTTLDLELNPCPQRGALMENKRWQVQETNFKGRFSGVLRQASGILTADGDGYSLDEEDLATATLEAWAIAKSDRSRQKKDQKGINGQAIALLKPGQSISGESQMVVDVGAKVQISPNLQGQHISLLVGYASAVVISPHPIGKIRAHVVGRMGSELRYLGIPGCSAEVRGRSLRLNFNPEQNQLIKL